MTKQKQTNPKRTINYPQKNLTQPPPSPPNYLPNQRHHNINKKKKHTHSLFGSGLPRGEASRRSRASTALTTSPARMTWEPASASSARSRALPSISAAATTPCHRRGEAREGAVVLLAVAADGGNHRRRRALIDTKLRSRSLR